MYVWFPPRRQKIHKKTNNKYDVFKERFYETHTHTRLKKNKKSIKI